MRVLLTGCNGQVGFLLREKLKNKYNVMALTRQQLDITDARAVSDIIHEFQPTVIINAAAYTAVDKAEVETELAYKINSDGPKNLAIAAEEINAALIHFSTDYVFEGNKVGSHIETDPVNPQGIYGESKLAGERSVSSNCTQFLIIRTAWVFGEHGNNFVKTMLRLAASRDELSIVGDQFGGPTYAGDIADATISIVDRIEQEVPVNWGIYHFTGAPFVSWFEFAEVIFERAFEAKLLSKKPTLNSIGTAEFPTSAKRPANSKLDCSAIYTEFGISPSDWQAELCNICNYSGKS